MCVGSLFTPLYKHTDYRPICVHLKCFVTVKRLETLHNVVYVTDINKA
jgi:hypothetical protein